ncbi:hypothetical protein JCM3765_004936 [Sporobolomyces pararoseus]
MQLIVARQALSVPAIVSAIVDQLLILCLADQSAPKDSRLAQGPAFYSALCTASLISSQFYKICHEQLESCLFFVGGTRQLVKWLEKTSRLPLEERYSNARVHFVDTLPFKEGKLKEGNKWDFEVVGKVLEQLKDCKELCLGFMGQEGMPVEWLAMESLKDLKVLQIASPLRNPPGSSPKPAFKALSQLVPVDSHPEFSRDWTSTFTYLSTSHERPVGIHTLNLTSFPCFTRYLVPSLLPFSRSIVELCIPNLELETSSGSLFSFSQSLHSLKRLSISNIDSSSIPTLCLLLVFPSSLELINFDTITGSLAGHYDWSPEGQAKDTYHQLLEVMEKMKNSHELKGMQWGKAKWFLPEHQRGFAKLCTETDMGLAIGEVDNKRTSQEAAQFTYAIQSSLQNLAKAEGMYNVHGLTESIAEDVKKVVQSAVEAHQNGGQLASNGNSSKVDGDGINIDSDKIDHREALENGVAAIEEKQEKGKEEIKEEV